MWYKLDEDNKPIPVTVFEYHEWSKKNPDKKAVKQEYVKDVYISTVFLGLDHSHNGKKPILWETMTFSTKHVDHDQSVQLRHTSYEDALEVHEKVKQDIIKKLNEKV
jgi:hypothetical protein